MLDFLLNSGIYNRKIEKKIIISNASAFIDIWWFKKLSWFLSLLTSLSRFPPIYGINNHRCWKFNYFMTKSH